MEKTSTIFVVVSGEATNSGNHPYCKIAVFLGRERALEYAARLVSEFQETGARYTPLVRVTEHEEGELSLEGFNMIHDSNPLLFGGTEVFYWSDEAMGLDPKRYLDGGDKKLS